MNISETMDLEQLPEVRALGYGPSQIRLLQSLLLKSKFQNLDEVPPEVWASMLEEIKVRFRPA